MALTENNGGIVMPVAPMQNYGGGFGGGFGMGGDWAWILLLLVLGGGWGGFGGFGMNGFGAGMLGADMGGWGLYPWLNNSEHISDGFRDQQLSNQVGNIQNSVTSGFGDVQNALCSGFGNVQNSLCAGFAGVNASINGAQNALAQQMYTNQISDLERSFAAQTANTQGLTNLSSQLANCCCENRAATADVKYTIATEACATRANSTANTQAILDKLCALELDGYKRENDQLRSQLTFANMQASQVAQTAQILAGQSAEIDGVYNRLKNCPVGTYNVCNPLTPVSGCTSCGGF